MVTLISQAFQPTYLRYPPAFFHPRILVGAGSFLSVTFVKRYNITHVINCASDRDSPDWWRFFYPNKYTCLNAIDSPSVNILDWYTAFESAMKQYLRESDGVIYVHCQAGMNRSASLALAYVVKNLGMEFDTVVSATRKQRPCLFQNPVFMDQVREFVNGRVQDSKTS